ETYQETQALQGLVSRADWDAAKTGVPGTKYLLNKIFGYNARPRLPLLPTPEDRASKLWQESSMVEILELEKKLAGDSK
ncbi:hypothetical protein V5O48_003642, partial [Marasmius crinis-equi]